MQQVFISYARDDRRRVEALAERLRRLVDGVWFDSQLHGGEDWWAGILERIRGCDVFLAVVSSASLDSEACRIERQYAASVRRTILPVALETVPPALPSDVASLQIVDFSTPGEQALSDLARALLAAPDPEPLPDPLPPDPEAPLSYLTDLVDLVNSPRELTKSEQMEILFRLERGLESSDHDEREGARQVLQRMKNRDDLATSVEKTINLLAHEKRPPGPHITPQEPGKDDPVNGDVRAADRGGGQLTPIQRTSPRPASSSSSQRRPSRMRPSQSSPVTIVGVMAAVGSALAFVVFQAAESVYYWEWSDADWVGQVRSAYNELTAPIARALWVLTLLLMINAGVAVARRSRLRSPLEAAVATLAASMRSLPLVVIWTVTAVVLDQMDFITYAMTMVLAATIGLAGGVLWATVEHRGAASPDGEPADAPQ